MTAPLTIYGLPPSSYVWTTRTCLNEKGVAYELVAPDFKSAEGLKRHPFGKMPAMQHGDVALYETLAITHYIDAVFDGRSLVPSDPVDRARMYQVISAFNDYMYQDLIRDWVLQVVFPRGADGKPDADHIESCMPNIKRDLKVLDTELGRRKTAYLVADEPCLGDLFLGPALAYCSRMPGGEELLADHPNIGAFLGHIGRRESFVKAAPPQG